MAGSAPPSPRCLWGLADGRPSAASSTAMPIAADDSDDVFDHGALTPPASPRTLWAPASGSGDVITIDAAIMGALDDAAFVASCGARISAAADADDVLGDDYDAGAYVSLLAAASFLLPLPPKVGFQQYAAVNPSPGGFPCDDKLVGFRLLCGFGWTPFV